MSKRNSRRTPERIAIGWSPFMLGAAVAVFAADAKVLMFANLLVGLAFALLLASSTRSTGGLLRLLPRFGRARHRRECRRPHRALRARSHLEDEHRIAEGIEAVALLDRQPVEPPRLLHPGERHHERE